jgi:hypothetical protein
MARQESDTEQKRPIPNVPGEAIFTGEIKGVYGKS